MGFNLGENIIFARSKNERLFMLNNKIVYILTLATWKYEVFEITFLTWLQ